MVLKSPKIRAFIFSYQLVSLHGFSNLICTSFQVWKWNVWSNMLFMMWQGFIPFEIQELSLCEIQINISPALLLTLIREYWKKIQNAGPSPSMFCGKNPERSIELICMFLCFGFSGNDARLWSQKMIYIFVQRRIFPLILAYAIWN